MVEFAKAGALGEACNLFAQGFSHRPIYNHLAGNYPGVPREWLVTILQWAAEGCAAAQQHNQLGLRQRLKKGDVPRIQ